MPISIAPPQTDVEIITMACSLCGKGDFNSVASGGQFAQDASRFYGALVSAELGSNRWRFAQTFQAMGVLNALNPSFEGWLFYWEFPADLIMLHRLDREMPYVVFGTRVLTKTNQSANAIYSINVPVSKWPPAFAFYIAHALATKLGISVTNSDRLLARLDTETKLWQDRALFADGQNSPTRTIRSNPWTQIRFNFRQNNGSGPGNWYP
jgi:hypothetical protein